MPMRKVEKFKVSPEQIEWTKQFKKIAKITSFLQGLVAAGEQKLRKPRELLKQSVFGLDMLMRNKPGDKLHELHEQPKLEE